MGPIQSGINQSLAILSLASSQSPQAQANRQATADTKAFNKFRKTDEKTPFALGERSQEMFNELKEQSIESNLKAGRTEDLVDINKAKPEAENIRNDIRKLSKEIGLEDLKDIDMFINKGFESLREVFPDIPSKEAREILRDEAEMMKDEKINQIIKALQGSSRRLSTKKRIKVDMNMMKSTLKEDN